MTSSWSHNQIRSLNPNAEEFIPFILQPVPRIEKKLPRTAGKNLVSEEDAVGDLRDALPDDLNFDYKDMVDQDSQSSESLSSAFSSRGNHLNLIDKEHLIVGEELFAMKKGVNPLEFLSSRFPQFPMPQLLEMYLSNGHDLKMTSEQLVRFEVETRDFSRHMSLRRSIFPQSMQQQNGPYSDYDRSNFSEKFRALGFLPSSPESTQYTPALAPHGFALGSGNCVQNSPVLGPDPALSSSFRYGTREQWGEVLPGRSDAGGNFLHLHNRVCLHQFRPPPPSKFSPEPFMAEQSLHFSRNW